MDNQQFWGTQPPTDSASTGDKADPTPSTGEKKKYARAKLGNAKEIANEMARVYRLMKSGELDPNIGTKLTYVLQSLAKLRVEGELEDRISALEQQREVKH